MNNQTYPMILLETQVIFPGTTLSFNISGGYNLKAVELALEEDRLVFLGISSDLTSEAKKPGKSEVSFYKIGCIGTILQADVDQNEIYHITVKALSRAKLTEITSFDTHCLATVRKLSDRVGETDEVEKEANVAAAKDLFNQYSELTDNVPLDVCYDVLFSEQPGTLADYIAYNCPFKLEDKCSILGELDPLLRLEKVMTLLSEKIEVTKIEKEITARLQRKSDRSMREHYIREQIKELSAQLGTVGDDPQREARAYRERLDKLSIPAESKEKLLTEINNFANMPTESHDAANIRTHLDTVLALPWGVETEDCFDLKKAGKMLNEEHYGLDKVKERILEFIAVHHHSPNINGEVLCFVGPPGIGKTTIASSIAKALDRRFVRVSLGGIEDEPEIRGHRRTYIGAMMGCIMKAIEQAKSANPVLLLDEVDKLVNNFRGNPTAVLLELLDPQQNSAFRDRYVEVPFDLSHVIFIATANDFENIPEPLRDRMEMIEISSYTAEEKKHIAREHIITRELKKHALTKRQFKIDDEAIDALIEGYTAEAGVRELTRQIAALCRKTAVILDSDGVKSVHFTEKNLKEYLGAPPYGYDFLARGNQVGLANGLAWTWAGGKILQIEVNLMKGTGKVELTGNLGDIMKESAGAAISFLRANASSFGVSPDFYKKYDIHIHVPFGATKKDGPSAGIAIASALLSALTDRPFNGSVAMTGEITIRGRVLPIGGLKEKSMAAYKNGFSTVIIPKGNEMNLDELDSVVKDAVTFIPVSDFKEVADLALLPKSENL